MRLLPGWTDHDGDGIARLQPLSVAQIPLIAEGIIGGTFQSEGIDLAIDGAHGKGCYGGISELALIFFTSVEAQRYQYKCIQAP